MRIDRLLKSALAVPLRALRRTFDPERPDERRIPYPRRTPAGMFINADLALKNATVWACVRYLSQTTGVLPWRVFRPGPRMAGVFAASHPLNRVLGKRPNPEWSSMQFRETLIAWALLRGNGYAEIERDAVGRAVALWPIHPERVTTMRDEDSTLFYRVHNGGQERTDLDAIDMFHLRGFGEGPVGLNVMEYAAESIGWARATEVFGSTFFGENLNPAGVISTKSSLSIDAEKELRKRLDNLHKGPHKSNRWVIVDNDGKFIPMTTVPEQAQFIETRQHQVEEITRWFGVPPHKVMHLLRATFSNIEHQAIEVVVDSITPWTKRLEDEADYKLFGQNRQGLYTKINLNALMRGDAKSRGEFYQLMRQIGAMSVNDILALEDMNPIGPEGDKRVMQSQFTTLERIGEDPAPPEPPDEPEDPDAEDEVPEDLAEAAARALAWHPFAERTEA